MKRVGRKIFRQRNNRFAEYGRVFNVEVPPGSTLVDVMKGSGYYYPQFIKQLKANTPRGVLPLLYTRDCGITFERGE